MPFNRFILSLCLLAVSVCPAVFGRSVHLEWEPIEGATSYEFEISRNGEKVIRRRVESGKTSWDANLPVGVYVFRLRAIDWTKQPGEWSEAAPLISSPPEPSITTPAPNAVIPPPEAAKGVVLRWEPVAGVQKYQIEITKDGQKLATHNTSIPGFLLRNATPGTYQFRVACLVEYVGELPAAIKERVFVGDFSAHRTFSVKTPEPVKLPKKVDPLDEPQNYFAVSPIFTAFQLGITEREGGTTGAVTSNVNPGLDIDAGFKLGKAWSLATRLQMVSSKIVPPAGWTLSNDYAFLTNIDVTLGVRPARAPKVEVRLLLAMGDLPVMKTNTASAGSQFIYQPYTFWRAGMGFSAHLFRLWSFNCRLEGSLNAIFTKQGDGEMFRNGVIFSGTGVAETSLTKSLLLRGVMTFSSTYINSTLFDISRQELILGGGLTYRF